MLFKQSFLTLFLFFAGILFSAAIAQSTISGTVTDASDTPLPGVSVVVKGTTTGVSTDFDGLYTINVDSPDATLIFSYIGFVTQEIAVGANNTVDVQMAEDVQNLEEVVVVGYGTQKKATLTGSVASVSGDALEKSASPNLGAALAGKVSGLFIDTGSATPGADTPAIRVRGTNTFNNSGALVVIDGIPDRKSVV